MSDSADQRYGREAERIMAELAEAMDRARRLLHRWEDDREASNQGRRIAREALLDFPAIARPGFRLENLQERLVRDN